jgi:DNA-binding MarR family transcriptional regulator
MIVATIIAMPIATSSHASASPLQGCTNLKLRQLTRRVTQFYDTELASSGLKTTQYSLLSHVLKLGPLRPVDLALAMKMDASTLTRNLKPLIDAGWVVQAPGADLRSRLVTISDAGREKRLDAQQNWKRAQTALNRLLGLERVRALHALMDECQQRLAQTGGGDA